MNLMSFDRLDRVGTELLVAVVWISATMALVIDPVRRWLRDLPLLLEVPDGAASSTLEVTDPSAADRLVMMLPGILAVIALTVGAWLTIGLLRAISSGDPFDRTQVRRLRVIAALLLLVPAAVSVGTSLATSSVSDRHDLGVGEVAIWLPLPWLLAGLVVAATAQAFVAGAALRDEVEGLV